MDGGGAKECFIWENQAWTVTNSENSGEKSGKRKLPDSSNSGSQPPAAAGQRESSPALDNKDDGGDGDGGKVNEAKLGDGVESDHDEVHIWTERERRKKMRNMFSDLHALLPQLPPKADKATIVDEAVNYIKTLEHTLQKLQKQKMEILHHYGLTNYDPSSSSTPIFGRPSQKLMINGADLTTSREAFLASFINAGPSSSSLAADNNTTRFPGVAAFQTWTSPNVILNVCGDDAHISVCCPKKQPGGFLTVICFVLEKYKIEVVSAQVSSDHHRSMYMIQAHAITTRYDNTPSFSVEEMYKQAAGEIMLWITNHY